MGNEIIWTKTGDRPPPADAKLARALSIFRSRVARDGVPRIDRTQAPNPAERALLVARHDQIKAGFVPCDRIVAAEAVLRMFDAWPSFRMEADKAKRVVIAYTDQLTGLPAWAVHAGVAVCQRRAVAFPPSAGELREACDAEVQTLQLEVHDINLVLNAEMFDAHPRGKDAIARIRSMARKLGAPAPSVARHQDFRENARDRAERNLAAMDYATKPVTVSGDLFRSLR